MTEGSRPVLASVSLTDRIDRAYPDLTEAERRLANFIFERPGDLATFAAKELAERAGVSNATMSRLIRRLGYVNYDEARLEARSMLRTTGSPLHLFDSTTPPGTELVAGHLNEEKRLLEMSLALDPDYVREAARHLATAPRVWFVGFRNSRFLADYGRAIFTSLRSGSYALAPSGQTLGEGVADVGRGDIVVAYGMRRRLGIFGALLGALSKQEADILLITDRSMPALQPAPRWSFICAVETTRAIDSYTGVIAVTRLLALETMRELGEKSRNRLSTIEAAQAELNELE